MKSLFVLGIFLSLLTITIFAGCGEDASQTVPAGNLPSSIVTEVPDDIVFTPGGHAYRANVHQEGVPDKWPSIKTEPITLDNLNIRYRADIETGTGETRNNIITVIREGRFHDSELTLYFRDIPDGMELTDTGGAGLPGTLVTVIQIAISPYIPPGQYIVQIGIIIDDRDYGTIPCTVNIIE